MEFGDSSELRSGVYECEVRHERFVPRSHRFAYRLFYLALDLDELPELGRRSRVLGVNRRGLMSFWERDYLPVNEPLHRPASETPATVAATATLKERVLAWCAAQGVTLASGTRVLLVTLPRVLGYQFNPVSFYFCIDPAGRPQLAIAEVTNTFREMKAFLIPPAGDGLAVRVPKHFYVSPFSPADAAFDFTLRLPGSRLALRVDDYEGAIRTLHSTLTGTRRPLTDSALVSALARHPLVTLRVIALIHWEALRLWARRVPYFRKTAATDRQRDLRRPHLSLQPTS